MANVDGLLHLLPARSRRDHLPPPPEQQCVGETEAAIRKIFERAQQFAPAVILFDEIDSIAPSRSAESAQHQVSVVAQLLVLRDGIAARGQISVLATTNRPEHVDPGTAPPCPLRSVVWMGLPDQRGRADALEHYLRDLKLATGCRSTGSPPSCPAQHGA